MSENEVDQIARETAMMGRSALAAIHQWRMQNPGKTRIPRGVQKKALRLWRNEMAAHQVQMAHNRRVLRAEIAGRVEWHRQHALDTWARSGGYPTEQQQEQLVKARQEIERTIARAPEFTATERGQAISALVSAHYATDPAKPAPPVWGGRLAGISALRARLADRLSRQQLGIAAPGRHGLGRPTTPTAGLHSYWTQPRPAPSFQAPPPQHASQPQQVPLAQQQPGVSTADIERIEARQRQLAEQIALANRAIAERDQLQAKVQDLGARYVDSQQLNRQIADDLASRGRELTDVHTELDRVRTERDALAKERDRYKTQRDEAVQKVIERTPAAQRLGSPQRQQAERKRQEPRRESGATPNSDLYDRSQLHQQLVREATFAGQQRSRGEIAEMSDVLGENRGFDEHKKSAVAWAKIREISERYPDSIPQDEFNTHLRSEFGDWWFSGGSKQYAAEQKRQEQGHESGADQSRVVVPGGRDSAAVDAGTASRTAREPIPGHAFAGLVNGHDREREGMER
ncbi:hypothetical protein ABZ413_36575 [Nocardia rhamnosiphila]|uniref:hypothetical protein n=1 Tax=Nocardia rhamnosiphila TaxID=426716 RepID=UPI0033D985D7